VWRNGTTPQFAIDLGNLYAINDVLLSVDNNDGYRMRYSIDNRTYTDLFSILVGHGEGAVSGRTVSQQQRLATNRFWWVRAPTLQDLY
jgi:hypothetical protein